MRIDKKTRLGEVGANLKIVFPYSIFILVAAVVLLVFAAYLNDEMLQKWGAISFWLSVAGRCFSWLMDWSEKSKK